MARMLALVLTGLAIATTAVPGQDPAVEETPADASAPLLNEEKSPLVREPTTPDQMYEAVELMLDVNRPRLARMYLDKLLEATPDDDTLNRLRSEYGTSSLLRMSRTPELKDAAAKLIEMSNAAATRMLRDPARISELIAKLGGDPIEEEEAVLQLRAVGVAAVPSLLQILNNPSQAMVHASALRAVVEIGNPSVPPLLAALDAPNDGLRASAATALGYLGSLEAEPYLWQPALSDPSAGVRASSKQALARILKLPPAKMDALAAEAVTARMVKASQEYSRHQHAWPVTGEPAVTLWVFDPQESTVIPRQLSPLEADEILASRFAKLAIQLAPERRDVQVQALSTALAADMRLVGPEGALPRGEGRAYDLALTTGRDVMDDTLKDALAHGNPLVALACLEVLEEVGTKDLLRKGTGLIAALNSPDRRVQFAAATAILRLDPNKPFPGSPRVVAILHRALENVLRPRAVVVQSSPKLAAELGGFVNELGYDSLVGYTGREAFRNAVGNGDVELIVLHANIVRWTLSETLANLRADARTAGVPIVVVGPESLRLKLDVSLAKYPQVFFVAEQTDVAGFASQLKPFLSRVAPPLTEQELADQRSAAVAWMGHLAANRRTKIFPLTGTEGSLSKTLTDEATAADGLLALHEIPSAESQRLLHAVATDDAATPELRINAADKLAMHIQRHGLLLADAQVAVLHQHLAAAQDPRMHAALSAVVGSLRPNAALVGERIQRKK